MTRALEVALTLLNVEVMRRAWWLWLAVMMGCSAGETLRADAGGDAFDAGVIAPDAGTSDGGCQLAALDLNDVTFIYPLPGVLADQSLLLGVDTEGRGGALLPSELRGVFPSFIADIPGADRSERPTIDDVRVIAARVDPCFPGPMKTCRRQLRLVAQPLRDVEGVVEAIDATVHLFYDLDEPTFGALVDAVKGLKARAGDATACRPLGVHPVMAGEGLRGPFAAELNRVVRQFAGRQTLTRVAFMQLGRADSIWGFMAFDVSGDRLVATPIPTLGATTEQRFFTSDVGLQPETVEPERPGTLLRLLLAPEAVQSASDQALAAAVDEALRLENPTREDPTTVDCVSCHVADRARRRAEQLVGRRWTSTSEFTDARFSLVVPAGNTGLRSQRALGYFGAVLSVNQRVINESAVVAAQLRQ